MKHYKTALAAVDFSKYSGNIADHAASIARKFKAELVLINVINQRDIDVIHYTYQVLKNLTNKLSQEELVTRLRHDRESKMKELINQLKAPHLPTRFIIRVGVPFQEIIAVAKEVNADLVFAGEKGRSDLADVIIGSTIQKLIRKCPVTLVTVR